MKIGIAVDHAGFDLKEQIKAKLKMRRVEVVDLGAFDATPSDYPDFAATLGEAVIARRIERGILICGSGVGASVAANKISGIRAGLCHDCYPRVRAWNTTTSMCSCLVHALSAAPWPKPWSQSFSTPSSATKSAIGVA